MVTRFIGFIILLTLTPAAAASAQAVPPAVPANLEVPSGAPFLIAAAEGTQNYICVSGKGGFAWTFYGPQATLFGESGEQVITHFLSPNPAEDGTPRATWQHSIDTSAVWAAALASSTDPAYVAAGSIPWLLLRVVGSQPGPAGGTTVSGAVYIQRVNTAGGVAPAVGCNDANDIGKKALVPYTTDYVFYR
jgi:hypothetical protein